ncbi:hypothetical protein HDU86_008546 [Geranomyces michiganensis]|nr:hypothetical protein HDU86_008546 [Geranomyces michiganensis]
MLSFDDSAAAEVPVLAATAEPPVTASVNVRQIAIEVCTKPSLLELKKVTESQRMPSPPLAARSSSSLPRSASIAEPYADEPDLLDPAHREFCVSTYPYVADKNDELSFAEGQVIRVVRQVNGGWWEGQLGEQVGWFPANHVKKLERASENHDVSQTPDPTLQQLDDFRLCTILRNSETRASVNASAANPSESPDDAARFRVLEHILAMETQYVDALVKFTEEFVHPLAEEEWFPPRDHQAIFGNMAEIVEFEKDLRTMLTQNISVERKMGTCLLSMTDRFQQVYEEYCANLPQAVTVSTLYARNASMSQFLQSTSANSTPPILHLVSALHKPAQWKNRFQVALHELLHVTPEGHVDREDLKAASVKLDAIVEHIEHVKSGNENHEVVQSLMGQIIAWEGPRLEFFGDLILEDTLKLSDGVRKRERRFYLLQRLLLILKPEHNGKPGEINFRVVEKLPLTSTILISVPETQDGDGMLAYAHIVVWDAAWNLTRTHFTGGSLSFQLSYQTDDAKVRSLPITAFNLEQRDKWISAITRQLERNVGDDDYRIGLSGSKSERSLKWLSSLSEKMRKKRPSIPRLKDLVIQPNQFGSSRADSAPLRTSASKSGLAFAPSRIGTRSYSATDIAHSAPSRDETTPSSSQGSLDKASVPAKHRSSPARAVHTDLSPPASVFTTSSRGRSSLRSPMHSSSPRATVISISTESLSRSCSPLRPLSGDRRGKPVQDRDDAHGGSLEGRRSRPQSSYTGSLVSPSSSPASFLWMQTDVGGKHAETQTQAPESPTRCSDQVCSAEAAVAELQGGQAPEGPPVTQTLAIAAPIAKSPPHVLVQALERQADLQGDYEQGDTGPLHPVPLTSQPGELVAIVMEAHAELRVGLAASAAPASEKLPYDAPAVQAPNVTTRDPEQRTCVEDCSASADDDMSAKNRWSHVSKMTVDPPVADPTPTPESTRRPTFPLYPNRSNASVPVRPSPEQLYASMSLTDLSVPRQPQRKSSVANLVQGVKGSLKTLFRRSQSNNALQTAPQPGTQDSPQTPPVMSRPPLAKGQRKSSLMDVKDFLFRSRRASTASMAFMPGSHSTWSLSARGTPRAGEREREQAYVYAPSQPPVPEAEALAPAPRVEPVIVARRTQQPAHVVSPPQSTRTSFEELAAGVMTTTTATTTTTSTTTPINTTPPPPLCGSATVLKYASLAGCQAVPLPSPLPSAPSSRVSLVFASPESAVVVDLPGRLAAAGGGVGVGGTGDQPETRVAPDSGVYGLMNANALGKDGVDGAYHFPERVVKDDGEEELLLAGAKGDVDDESFSIASATTSAKEWNEYVVAGDNDDDDDDGGGLSGRLRSHSLTVERSSAAAGDEQHQFAAQLRPEDSSNKKRVRATSHPHRVLRRARSNLGAFSKKKTTTTAPAAAEQIKQARPNDDDGSDALARAPSTMAGGGGGGGAAEEYGPVIGQLERRWYTDLAQKCEAMSLEIRELKSHLQAIADDKKEEAKGSS